MRNLRVAYIGIKGLPARGGAERVVEAIVKRMPALGVEPTVYCDTRYTPSGTRIEGVRLIRLPTIPGKHTRPISLDILAAYHAVLCGNYDLVHLHHTEASFILPILRARYKAVCTSHGSAYRLGKWGAISKIIMRGLDWPFMRMSSAPTFVSAVDAERLSKTYMRQAIHIPNGVSTDHILDMEGAREIERQYGLSPGNYLLFVAARIEPIKGADIAINAVANLENKVPLLLIGDINQVPEYGQKLRESAKPNVIFHPPVSDPAVLFGLMSDAKLLIFPSLVEAMSMVLLEAASLGVPVIASDIPENTAFMQDDMIYFSSGDVKSLTDQLRWAIKNPEQIQHYAERAQLRTQEQYSWDSISQQYADLYRKILERED